MTQSLDPAVIAVSLMREALTLLDDDDAMAAVAEQLERTIAAAEKVASPAMPSDIN